VNVQLEVLYFGWERVVKMEDRAGASVEEAVDGVERGKSWVRERRG